MFIGGTLGYRLLNWIKPPERLRAEADRPTQAPERSKLLVHWGEAIYGRLAGKKVLDFGCGFGGEAIDLARRGIAVTGLDIRPAVLDRAREAALAAGVGDRVRFVTQTRERFDVILSLDAFEHFDDPGHILRLMADLLQPDGHVLASFGPTWLHPLGGHLFSVFPWAHLLFTEEALIRWRAGFSDDGARRFRECSGGLNQITIGGFRRLVARGPFRFAEFDTVPIRGTRLVHNAMTRELFTSLVRCKLVLKGQGRSPLL
jgi:SAM-dependent methyltransferase